MPPEPKKSENQDITQRSLEAMSAGAAIVASDTAPVREVMRNGETGVLVDFLD